MESTRTPLENRIDQELTEAKDRIEEIQDQAGRDFEELQKRRERLRERSSTTPVQPASAHTPRRDISSARTTSTIAIAVSARIRVTRGVSAPTQCRCQS